MATSKRYTRLREATSKMLDAWKRGVKSETALATSFPTLSAGPKPVASALSSLYDQFWEQFEINAMASIDYFCSYRRE